MKLKYPKDISTLAEFLIKNGWKVMDDEEECMLSYIDSCCVRFDPTAGKAVDIEYMERDGKDFFVFSSIKSFLDFCKEKYILDTEYNDDGDTESNEDDGVIVYIDGLGEDTFDSITEALEYLNDRITITVNGKKRKLK